VGNLSGHWRADHLFTLLSTKRGAKMYDAIPKADRGV
jgi:hypothetical protein